MEKYQVTIQLKGSKRLRYVSEDVPGALVAIDNALSAGTLKFCSLKRLKGKEA